MSYFQKTGLLRFDQQFLAGGSFSNWLGLLRDHGGVDLRYWPRLAYISAVALLAAPVRAYERRKFGALIECTELHEPPIFILGHWRSGTTHLHNLLSVGENYRVPTTFQAAFPHIFLRWEKTLAPWLDRLGPGERLMDRMAMTMSSPQEEEIALASLGVPSSYLAVYFPQNPAPYRKYVSFREASLAEQQQWETAHRWFLSKLQAQPGLSKPLLLKSPANTARVRWLLKLYPDARFIHIHRDPYETIRSTQHLLDAWFQMAHFQRLDTLRAQRDAQVLDAYEDLHRCWFEEEGLIPPGRLQVVSFAALKNDPLAVLETLYQFLDDAPFPQAALQAYLTQLRGYRQNRYEGLSPEMQAAVNERMGFVFEGFGYERKSPGSAG